jgi:hypothetical protein
MIFRPAARLRGGELGKEANMPDFNFDFAFTEKQMALRHHDEY